ncbi:hypothetical protein OG234_13500 [Streptomyces sp. NBC_01420]|uniref:hypothetical protein n=1 Tax=Streptomyces sp. NBC_01420 TaxID=2903858 RepID=UPI00324B981E
MTLNAPARPGLTPTGDPGPVLHALLDSITAGHPPETYLRITENRPDGGATVRHTWTTGGQPLGDHVDQVALAAGLDAADWLHIGELHSERSHRGRFAIEAFPLRPILHSVQAGERCPDGRRGDVRRFLTAAAHHTGRQPVPGIPRWIGMGPVLISRKTP